MRQDYLVNHKIRFPELRVITSDGENLGVLKTQDALRAANEREQDLVIIAENAKPPVAKILDFNKFLYEERKKVSAAKAKSKKSELKEFRFGPSIGDGDLMSKIERAKEFIKDGNRVKVTIKLKGRKAEFPQIGMEKANRFVTELAEIAKPETPPKNQGGMIILTMVGK